MNRFAVHILVGLIAFTSVAMPLYAQSSSNYKLDGAEFGGGGATGMSSDGYGLETILGEVAVQQSSSNYGVNSGLIFVQNANVPPAPTFQNSSNWYNKLHFIINTGSNPSDTIFAIAISTDDFVTTNYIQSDNTVGASLGMEDYQSYTDWGGASGENVIGLTPNTAYKIKVKAFQGDYTESAYGPTASASTSNVNLSFDIDISSSNSETAAPYVLTFGDLAAGSVNTQPSGEKVWIDLSTNADYGAYVYIYDQNAGIKSAELNYTISAVTGDLASTQEGMGVQGSTVGQDSGGPLALVAPYSTTTGHNVGIVSTTIREIFHTTTSPITNGRGSFHVKIKPSVVTPAGSDYADILTLITAATF